MNDAPGPACGASLVDVTAQLGGEPVSFPCAQDQSLLDAALAAGLTVPYSCREGHCGACMVIVRDGTVDTRATSGLSRRDRAKGYVLACQTHPRGTRLSLSYDG